MSTRIVYAADIRRVDWNALKADLAADEFDNGRTPEELERSFANSHSVVMAWAGNRVVGTARLIADGVCNAYLVDVWTASKHRRTGIGSNMVARLLESVPGHHVGLFTEAHTDFYRSLGFEEERVGMSLVVGRWLNRDTPT
jgi:ribosomal protein S18 acetylase RimI-like enzyme